MMSLLDFVFNIAWRVLAIYAAFLFLKWFIRDGAAGMRRFFFDIGETIRTKLTEKKDEPYGKHARTEEVEEVPVE